MGLSQVHPLAPSSDTWVDALYEPLPVADAAAPTDAAAAASSPRAASLRARRPNLIYIMADDSGYGDLGANGFGADTPFLDFLAARSLRFTDFHSGASVCTPSRASVMTGRLPIRTGVWQNFEPRSMAGLPLDEITLADLLLHGANYSTAVVGKWHLGHVTQNAHEGGGQ